MVSKQSLLYHRRSSNLSASFVFVVLRLASSTDAVLTIIVKGKMYRLSLDRENER